MSSFRQRFIDLTPAIRAPGSGVGQTAQRSFDAIRSLAPEIQAASRTRTPGAHWIHPVERLMGRKGVLYHSFEHRMSPFMKGTRLLSIHDLWTLKPGNAWQSAEFQARQAPLLAQAIRRADWITTPSRAVLRQLHERFPSVRGRSQYIPWGPTIDLNTPIRHSPGSSATLPLPQRPFFLTVANLEVRKNLSMIIEATRGLSGFDWVFAGRPGHGSEQIIRMIHGAGNEGGIGIHLHQNLSTSQLHELYRRCEAVVLPSHDEGFGLPALEAAVFGRPLILSNIEPFREIAVDAALYFDPVHGCDALRAHLLQLLEDSSLSRRLSVQATVRASLFSWEKTARSFVEVYEKLA